MTAGDDFEGILRRIGFTGLEKMEDSPLDSAIYPETGIVFIGYYKGNLFITAQQLPLYLVDPETNAIGRRIIETFPDDEICAISLSGTINHWAFAVIDQGSKVRAKAGDMDNGTVLDAGQPLEEELELLSRSKMNSRGEREYYLRDGEEPLREDQVGENIIFSVVSRYTGEPLDKDEDVFEAGLFGFRYMSLTGPQPGEMIFFGEWRGSYTYGEGYRESIKGRTVDFVIEMEVENGNLKGVSREENKEPATINGFIFDDFIGFVHQYPVKYSLNENGESVIDVTRTGSRVFYSGLFDDKTGRFRGIWRIEGRNNWGEWTMKKALT